ncbi:ParB/RepB/Spo0J family partition protein [Nocardia donostiensis]|uniref:ParB/RepB/Spo0J family partition protein n=1 Tax=Nocardia donostiensis TaxID=1538463 RepID=UPI0009D97639|nr:helix-turn-helix domain-containing protein [Nocardia donostiensis]
MDSVCADLLPQGLDPGRTAFGAVVDVAVSSLRAPDTPRIDGDDPEHVRSLAEAGAPWPPILVHRQTMRIIDGAHRVRAARLCGHDTIAAILFDGDEREAFVLAVRLNVVHGLPLSRGERRAAALRIIRDYPEWSNRAIAAAAGISDKTVAAVRRSAAELPQSPRRVARNGVVHRLDTAQARRTAMELLRTQPGVPIAEIARRAGISETTVKDVRRRMRRGEDPVPARYRAAPRPRRATPAAASLDIGSEQAGHLESVGRLRRDPAVRHSDSGRQLLRWLEAPGFDCAHWAKVAENLPPYHIAAVIGLARQRAEAWQHFAHLLEQYDAQPAAGRWPLPGTG